MARVSEQWSELKWTAGKSALRVFMVDGATDPVTAASLVAGQVGSGTFPWDVRLVTELPDVSRGTGPSVWRVIVPYSARKDRVPLNVPQDADFDLVTWALPPYVTDEAVDVDADGNPMQNSAGFPWDLGTFHAEFNDDHLIARRWQTSLDNSTRQDYVQAVNDDEIVVPGYGKIPPLCARIMGISPVGEWTSRTVAMQVEYSFHIRYPSFASLEEREGRVSPHDFRILDSSKMGNSASGPGCFMLGTEKAEIGLNGDGLPHPDAFSSATVDGRTPVRHARPPCIMALDRGPGAVFLRIKKHVRRSFNALYLFR